MNPQTRRKVILLSILLHVLFLLLWEGVWKLDFFQPERELGVPEPEPIIFDLQQPEAQQPKKVVETPQDARVVEKPKRADFLSDKNALARNPESDPKLAIGDAYSRGDLASHELPQPRVQPGQRPQPQVKPGEKQEEKETEKDEKEEKEKTDQDLEDFNMIEPRERIVAGNPFEYPPAQPPGAQEQLPMIEHDNQASRSEDRGSISFNTYNWDYAPYMLMLKRRISRNIFPPPAFTQLGMISGNTILRFKIYPDGTMKDLEILNYNGHQSLMLTSRSAVEISAPFPGLPGDFPEPYLEVTGQFIYFVKREYRE